MRKLGSGKAECLLDSRHSVSEMELVLEPETFNFRALPLLIFALWLEVLTITSCCHRPIQSVGVLWSQIQHLGGQALAAHFSFLRFCCHLLCICYVAGAMLGVGRNLTASSELRKIPLLQMGGQKFREDKGPA